MIYIRTRFRQNQHLWRHFGDKVLAKNFDLLRTDALKDKHHLWPALVERALARQASVGGALKLVSNLPYAAATPLIAELLLAGPVPE